MTATTIFRGYKHMENCLEKSIKKAKHHFPPATEWVATEKIHGTNFQVVFDENNTITCCSRHRILSKDETFFDYQELLGRYEKRLRDLNEKVRSKYDERNCFVRIYGEFFGGGYEPGNPKGAIQHEIMYLPTKEYYLFDILVNDKYIDIDDLISLAIECGFEYYSEIVASGTLDEILELDPCFMPNIPKKAGLEELEGNYAEGYVISPRKNTHIGTKLKLKNPKYCTITGPLKHPPNPNKNKIIRNYSSKDVQNYRKSIEAIIDDHRVTSVLTKYTDEDFKELCIEKLAKVVIEDAFEELKEDNEEFVSLLDLLSAKIKHRHKAMLIPSVSIIVSDWLDNRQIMCQRAYNPNEIAPS